MKTYPKVITLVGRQVNAAGQFESKFNYLIHKAKEEIKEPEPDWWKEENHDLQNKARRSVQRG